MTLYYRATQHIVIGFVVLLVMLLTSRAYDDCVCERVNVWQNINCIRESVKFLIPLNTLLMALHFYCPSNTMLFLLVTSYFCESLLSFSLAWNCNFMAYWSNESAAHSYSAVIKGIIKLCVCEKISWKSRHW